MAEPNSTWNLTVSATSPMFTYSSFTGDSSTGWATTCTVPDGYTCDQDTAHVTGAQASVSLQFDGSGIAFYGNVTDSMTVTLSIDGGQNTTESFNPSQQLLASVEGLQDGPHTALLTATPSSPAALLYFTQSVVSYKTGFANVQPDITYVDDLDPSISYGPYWYSYGNYDGAQQTTDNGTFHASNVYNTSMSLRFNASAVLLYGPCYASTGLYTVDVDPGPGLTTLNTTASGPQVAMHVFQNCLRYFALNLDPTVERTITMTNLENGTYATLDYIELIGFSGSSGGGSGGSGGSGSGSGGTAGGATGGNGSTGSSGHSNVGAIVGGVVGGIAAIALLLVAFFFWRRKQQRKEVKPDPFRPPVSLDDTTTGDVSPALATGSSAPPALSSNGTGGRPMSGNFTPPRLGSSPPPMSQKQALMAQYATPGRRRAVPSSTLSAPESIDPPTSSPSASRSAPSAPSSYTGGGPTSPYPPAPPPPPPAPPLPASQPSPLSPGIISPAAATAGSSQPFLLSPVAGAIGAEDAQNPPSLREISHEVNRIIAQLSRLGRPPAPGGTGEEDWEDEEDVDVPAQAPPAYDVSHEGNHY